MCIRLLSKNNLVEFAADKKQEHCKWNILNISKTVMDRKMLKIEYIKLTNPKNICSKNALTDLIYILKPIQFFTYYSFVHLSSFNLAM